MLEIMEALDSHLAQEGVEVEIRCPGGSWDDVRPMVTPIAEAWTLIGTLCNSLALDPEEPVHGVIPQSRPQSDLAHEILQMMAAAEHAVQERNS